MDDHKCCYQNKELTFECCPICIDPQFQPVTLDCGHTFCHPCIYYSQINRIKNCPLCRRIIVKHPIQIKVYKKHEQKSISYNYYQDDQDLKRNYQQFINLRYNLNRQNLTIVVDQMRALPGTQIDLNLSNFCDEQINLIRSLDQIQVICPGKSIKDSVTFKLFQIQPVDNNSNNHVFKICNKRQMIINYIEDEHNENILFANLFEIQDRPFVGSQNFHNRVKQIIKKLNLEDKLINHFEFKNIQQAVQLASYLFITLIKNNFSYNHQMQKTNIDDRINIFQKFLKDQQNQYEEKQKLQIIKI